MTTQQPPHQNTWDQTILQFSTAPNFVPLTREPREDIQSSEGRVESESYKVRFTNNPDRRWIASFLVEKMYGSRGYKTKNSGEQVDAEPDRIGLLVYGKNNQPVGTVTAGFDGPNGLLADEMYKSELDTLRGDGKRIVEMGKFAIEREAGNSKRIIASVTNIAYIYARILDYNYFVLEVNPRHVAFYRDNLGMDVIGPERICPRVDAPSILLGVSSDYMAEQIRKFGGGQVEAEGHKTLYRYFLCEEDEIGLRIRLSSGAGSNR